MAFSVRVALDVTYHFFHIYKGYPSTNMQNKLFSNKQFLAIFGAFISVFVISRSVYIV